MRTAIIALNLGAIVIFTIAPGMSDLVPHYLGHQAAATVTSPDEVEGGHGVHHKDCPWLDGTWQYRAVGQVVYAVFTSFSYTSWFPPVESQTQEHFSPILAGRSPPFILS